METVVSCTLPSMFCSMSRHDTLQYDMPRSVQTAVAVRRAICDGPARASLPNTTIVTESIAMSVAKGMALIHAGGRIGEGVCLVSSMMMMIEWIYRVLCRTQEIGYVISIRGEASNVNGARL